MKKLFVMMAAMAAAVCANADFIYWHVDEKDYGDNAWARLYSAEASTRDAESDTLLTTVSSVMESIPTTSTAVTADNWYYIVLGTMTEGSFTEQAISKIMAYSDLSSYIDSTGTDLKNHDSWNGTSFTAVPEPTSGLLLCLGAALLALRRKRA